MVIVLFTILLQRCKFGNYVCLNNDTAFSEKQIEIHQAFGETTKTTILYKSLSVKNGVWFYFSAGGVPTKKEIWNYGVLVAQMILSKKTSLKKENSYYPLTTSS